ncbi:MAG: PKD domain-containing protein [Acidobacteriota bacterium]
MLHRLIRIAVPTFLFLTLAQITPAQEIEEFMAEAVVQPNFLLTPTPPQFPPDLVAAISAGQLEIRARMTYSPAQKLLTVHVFLVPGGSPLPLPAAPPTTTPPTLALGTGKIESILISQKPAPNVLMTGAIVSTPVIVSSFGDLNGYGYALSFGYTPGTPAKFTCLTSSIAGSHTNYFPTAVGTLKFKEPTVPPAPKPNQAPVAVITPETQTVTVRQIQLDGTKSYDPDGDPITYSWKYVGKTAALLNPNSAAPAVQFAEGRGEYTFELTVTDSQGATSKATTKVMFVGW